ncbi:Protein sax-3 isoform 3 [Schistosoma japonicum]|uniref:Protein sax-3 isoform 3 n=1 Tax=Schistosoma japonicum TaxID=6182 RepID=A0A4Z2CV57_SCHJA|nr:Protein sax-3 isoform 3 [Schistosoma japonicum]
MGVFIWLHLAFIILTVILSSCCAIEFVDEPNETYGLENQQITLACSAIGPQNTTITWHKAHNVSIVHGSTKVMGNTVYSTYGFHLTNDNEGDYYCNASDGRHWVQSKKASVRISFLNEKFNLEPQSKVVNIGDTVLLECIPPFGLPSPTVEWLKENSSLLPSNRLQLMDVGNLRIDRITWKDSGHYTCVAKSFAYRRESSKAYLTVRQRPYFIVSPKSQSVPVHSVFEMSCRAAGEPSPVVVWRREPSLPSIPYSRVRLLLSGTLRFVSVQSNDSGYYVCRAVSSTGIIESVAYINVVTPPGLVVTPPSKIYTYEGNRVELFCSVTGSPFPDVRWLQWSTKTYFIPTVSASGRIYVTTAGNLIILAVRVEDTSTYECRASSPAGLTRSLTDVQVLFNQKLIPGRVGAVSAPHIYGRIFGSPTAVRIFCGVPLDPVFNYSHESHSVTLKSEFSTKSHIIWLNNGEFVPKSSSSGSRISIEADGSLLIYPFKAHDAGNYTCSVYRKISHRFAQYTFTVSSKDQNDSVYQLHTYDQLPSPPVNAGIVSVGDTWVVLKWFDNNPSESTSYKVYALPQIYSRITVQSAQHYENLKHLETSSDHMKSDELQMSSSKSFKLDTWFTVVEKTYHTQIRITGLIPDTGYWIEVRKVNSFGMSSGALVPYIVYTVRRPSEVIFSHSSLVNETVSDLTLKDPGSFFASGQTAVDFQELVSTFQSIDLHRISVRPLTSSELMVSWTVRSSNEVLSRIDGFKINVRSVPMSRCIAAVTSKSPNYLSTFRENSEDSESLNVYDADYDGFSFTGSVHCSFSSSKLLEQTIFMANTNSLRTNSKEASGHVTQNIIVMQSVSRDHPDAKAVVGGLLPFSCYETDIEAFKDDPTYGRILSRSSRSELALTLDAPPSFSPELISAEWLLQINPVKSEHKTESQRVNYTSPSEGIRLSWKPLELRMAHGALLGYAVHILANESQFSRSLHDYNQVNFNSNSFSLMDPLQPTEFVGPADRNHLLLPEDFHNVSWCNWHFASHNINSPVTREEQRQNAIPPPPEYPPPPLPSASSKVCDLPNLWIPISASEDLKRLELKNNQLRFVSDDSSLPSGGTYLSNCYSPLSGAYAETRYVSCTVPNSNVEFQNTGSCIVNSQANNFIELPSSNCIKQCLSPNIRYVTELHGSMCLMNGAHRLSPLGSAYPNTSVIINHGQFDSRLRGNNCQSLTDNSGNGESSSGLSATSGLGSTAIGSGSAKYPGCRRPDDMHPVNGHTSSCNSSNCSNVHMSIMHQNHNTSLYSSPSKQQIVHSNPKSILQLCNTSSASNSFCSSSANSKDGNTKEMEHYISKSNNNDLSKSFQCTMADDILSNNTTEFSSLHGYGKLQQKGGKQQQSTNSLVVCNPIISSSGGNFREFSMLSTEPPLLLPTTTSTLTYDHYFTESNFNNDLSHGSGVILVSNRDSNKSATSNTIRTIRT